MVTYEGYSSLDELPRRYRKRAEEQLFDGEEFVRAIDTKTGRFRSKHNQKLVLTDSRVIRMKSGVIRSNTEDYRLEDITSIQFDRGVRTSKITLQGSGIDDSYKVTKRLGQPFVSAVREQINGA